ncbi:MAG: tetratricopeptide repeat protein, partial [Acidobacteriales bacterium]|nr:tetratricopeptide repeat protein [Terriglobales bacterium]
DKRIRVTVQLLRVIDGVSLWADTFDEDFTNILAVQDAISSRVTEALAVKLTSEEKVSLAKHNTTNHQAYQAYVKGRHFLTLRTEHGFRKAIESFEQAVAADPGYALAYVGMAEAWTLVGYYNFSSPAESFVKVQTAVVKALGIDGNLADAQLALATIKVFYEWDFAGAEQAFRRAGTLKPNHDRLHWRYSIFLLAMKRFDEALAEITEARRRDPFHLALTVLEADILHYARRYDQAMAKYREALELDPNNFLVHAQLAEAYEQQGKYEEAMAEHEKALALSGDTPQMISEYKRVFQQSGIRGFWKQKIDLLTKAPAGRPNAYAIVATYIKLGEKEQAFAWLEKMYQERQPVLIYLNVDPIYDGLRSDPRFAELLRRTNLETRGI